MANKTRPIYLNLLQIRFPVAAVLSILHRVSGVMLFVATPAVIYLLDISLRSESGFARAADLIAGLPMRLVAAVLLWALVHHLFAGIRFLLIDIDLGVARDSARRGAWVVNVAALAVFVAALVVLL